MRRFGFSFTVILLRNSWAFSQYLLMFDCMHIKELLLDSLCSCCIFFARPSPFPMCAGTDCLLLGKNEEKNTATGVTKTSLSRTELDPAACDLEYACDIPGSLTSLWDGDAYLFCPISRGNLCLRQSEHAAKTSSERHSQ